MASSIFGSNEDDRSEGLTRDKTSRGMRQKIPVSSFGQVPSAPATNFRDREDVDDPVGEVALLSAHA